MPIKRVMLYRAISELPLSSDLTFPDQNKVRLWRDRTGQFRVKAEYLGVKAGKLRLHKSNGVIIEVPLDKMSPEDLATIPRDMDTISMRCMSNVPNYSATVSWF